MDIPTLAEADGPKSMQRQALPPKAETLELQEQSNRPVWAGPSWPIANSHGGARSMLSGTSPYGKSIDMADALHLSDTGTICRAIIGRHNGRRGRNTLCHVHCCCMPVCKEVLFWQRSLFIASPVVCGLPFPAADRSSTRRKLGNFTASFSSRVCSLSMLLS